jgi:guanine deaminase
VAERRMAVARSLHERVFAWLVLSDERNLVECRVAGEARYIRSQQVAAATGRAL